MSKEGTQILLKNGGLHVKTHESPQVVKTIENSAKLSLKQEFLLEETDVGDENIIQDGGSDGDITKSHAFDDLFDAENIAIGPDDQDDIVAFTTALVGNNSEWMKSQAGSGDELTKLGLQFQILEDDAEVEQCDGNHGLDHGISIGMKVESAEGPKELCLKEFGDLFSTTEGSSNDSNEANDISLHVNSEGMQLLTTHGVVTFTTDIASTTGSGNIAVLAGGMTCQSNPVSPSCFLKGENESAFGVTSAQGRLRRYSDSDDKITMQTKVFLEELERGSQLTAEEKELIENGSKEFQSLEYQSLQEGGDLSNKTSTFLTQEEINTLAGQGLDFGDEKINNREIRLKAARNQNIAQSVIETSSSNSQLIDSLVISSTDLTNLMPGISFSTCSSSSPSSVVSSIQSVAIAEENTQCAVIRPELAEMHNGEVTVLALESNITSADQLALAVNTAVTSSPAADQDDGTDYVSTDNVLSIPGDQSNIMHIVISSSKGEEIYQIDTSDLFAKAAIAMPSEVLVQPDDGKRDNGRGSSEETQAFPVLQLNNVQVIPVSNQYSSVNKSAGSYVGTITAAEIVQNTPQVMASGGGSQQKSLIICPPDKGRPKLKNKSPRRKKVEDDKKWVCMVCSQGFPGRYKLQIHMMKHTGNRPFKCPVFGCDWAFTTAGKLKRHEESHEGKKDFMCPEEGCGKKFTTIYNLNTHKKMHERAHKHTCKECSLKFPTQRQLDYHMRSAGHGVGEKRYECPQPGCGRKFFSRYCIGSHMRVHQRERHFRCQFEGCTKVFDQLCRLLEHKRIHTGERPFPCHFEGCQASFANTSKLRRHMRKHTGDRKWVCPFLDCGKAFMRAEHLKGHLVSHTGEKPFACTFDGCQAKFKCKSSLYVHLKRHNARATADQCSCGKGTDTNKKVKGKAERNPRNRTQTTLDLNSLLDLDSLVLSHGRRTEGPIGFIQSDISQNISINPSILNGTDFITVAIDADGHPVLSSQAVLAPSCPPTAVKTTVLPGTSLLALPGNQLQQSASQGAAVTGMLSGATVQPRKMVEKVNLLTRAGARPQVTLKKDKTSKAKAGGGSARTDFQSNMLLSNRAKKRRTQGAKESQSLDFSALQDGGTKQRSAAEGPNTSAPQVNPNEIMTSRAITFRDPETGAIYVQTQLLQDDPPNPDVYGDPSIGVLDPSTHSGFPADMVGILQDNHDLLEFTGTTINLQDLK